MLNLISEGQTMVEMEESTSNISKFYLEHIEKWQQSGLTQEKYCESANIPYSAFVYWRSKLRKGKKRQRLAKSKFVSLKPVKNLLTPKTSPRQISLTLSNGMQLTFPLSISSSLVIDCIKTIEESYDNV